MAHVRTDKFRNLDDFSGMASDWFWETDSEHRFCYFSRRMQDVTKFDSSSLIGRKRDVIPDEDLNDPKWVAHMEDLKNHRPFRNFEYQMRRPHDGTLLWIRIAGEPQFDADGAFCGYRGTGHDITQEKVAMQQLQESFAKLEARNLELSKARKTIENIAYSDVLTDLPNRRAFERDLKSALRDETLTLALLHVDLDRFKWVNDTLGHPAGDQVLETSAGSLKQVVGTDGMVYRVGGDEFTVIVPHQSGPEVATWLGDAIVTALDVPVRLGAQQVTVGASVGVALATQKGMDPERLMSHADAALYEAKRGGRKTVRLSTPELQVRIDDERRLAFDLPRAIANREFIPYFQPQFDATTQQLIGAEALARWNHPERGVLAPGAFLRAATELGKIDQIDRLILEEAMRAVDQFFAAGLLVPAMSINLSEARLMDPDLCDDLDRLWITRDCQLIVELLETIYFDEFCADHKFDSHLQRMRDIGLRIETDDFGTGRASITGLLRIAPDGLKIDKDLVQKVVTSPKQRSVVRGIIEMASALDIDCIAEGVETQDDIDAMIQLGCRRFQGYAFSYPLSERQFFDYVSRQLQLPQNSHLRIPPRRTSA